MMPLLALKLCSQLVSTAKDVIPEPKIPSVTRKRLGHKPSSYETLGAGLGAATSWPVHLLEPKLLRRYGRSPKIVGIDLRGKPENPTGWAVCEGSRAETCILFQDDEIITRTLAAKPDLVSIRSPLAVPRGRQSAFEQEPRVAKKAASFDMWKQDLYVVSAFTQAANSAHAKANAERYAAD